MTRLSDDKRSYVVDKDKVNIVDNVFSGEAIDRLGKFEDFYEALMKGQNQVQEELERLRLEGKEKSYRYKELMAKKLTEKHILDMLKVYGL